jgi:hypothetical protein
MLKLSSHHQSGEWEHHPDHKIKTNVKKYACDINQVSRSCHPDHTIKTNVKKYAPVINQVTRSRHQDHTIKTMSKSMLMSSIR